MASGAKPAEEPAAASTLDMAKVLSVLHDAQETLAEKASAALEAVVDAAPDALVEGAASAKHWVYEQGLEFANDVQAIVDQQRKRFEDSSQELKDLLETWVKQLLNKYIQKVVDKIPDIVKESTEDPDMPRFIARKKNILIDAAWPDFREEIMWQVAEALDGVTEAEAIVGKGPDPIRAFLRYHIYPYDKTIWGNLRDPVWVIFVLASLIPWNGVTPIIFFFIFLIIDKRDEFQLISFILQFKGMQYLSQGVFRTTMGFFMFIDCVTAVGKDDKHTCNKSGPGIEGSMEVTLGGWVLQIVLVWLAFALLRWSKDKGRRKLEGNIDFQHTSAASKAGGYIRYLLYYDIVCFIPCSAVLIWVMCTRPKWDDWPARQTLFAVQVVYGFLSLPFAIFTLPVLQNVLAHCVPTAYDKNGCCRKYKGPQPPKSREPSAVDKLKEIFDPDDMHNLLEQVKASVFGFSSPKAAGVAAPAEGSGSPTSPAADKPVGPGSSMV